jgi:selenocysteine lyase/cysteine desulfurase
MSPLLKTVEAAGMQGLIAKRVPSQISPHDFFSEIETLHQLFAQLINAPAGQVVSIPSVSYGMANAFRNIKPKAGGHAIIVGQEFPSDYLTADKWCRQHNQQLVTINSPADTGHKSARWNTQILEAITADTVVVVMSHTHWVDGTLFLLEEIGKRCQEVEALLLIDGTQSVGALPIDVEKFGIDALICGGYKWLLGPYSLGMAYYSPYFNNGSPIEESWMNRTNAPDFRNLTNYGTEYIGGARRYQVGEASNFILVPMLVAALRQLLDWKPENIQQYCVELTLPLIQQLQNEGFGIEHPDGRANHLFGFSLPAHIAEEKFQEEINRRNIKLSARGKSFRVSPHVYNTSQEVGLLQEALQESIR